MSSVLARILMAGAAGALVVLASRPLAAAEPGGDRRRTGRASRAARGAPRSRALQGDDQGTHALRRPPPGHRSQSRGRRLDRVAAARATAARTLRSCATATRRSRSAPPERVAGGARRTAGRRPLSRAARPDRCERRSTASARCQAARARDSQPSTPGVREEVYCTKVGSTHPEEMYIVGAHMDGIGWGEAANDDGSGAALVMELARVFSSPDVKTERSIRFVLWNNEETGLNGAYAYVEQRARAAGHRVAARVRALSRAALARHGAARHDAVRSRHAARGRHG